MARTSLDSLEAEEEALSACCTRAHTSVGLCVREKRVGEQEQQHVRATWHTLNMRPNMNNRNVTAKDPC